jgi:hypothetical protein
MGDSAEQEAAHGDMDHGLGDIEALLVVAHEPVPAPEPGEGSLDHQRRGRTWKLGSPSIRRTTSMTKPRKAALFHELGPAVGAVGEQMVDPWPALTDGIADDLASALSERSAGVRLSINSRPSVSTTICRLRPTVFLAAS